MGGWRSALVLSLGVLAGCRDRLTIPAEPLEVLSVGVSQADVVQGETGVGVTLRVSNASEFRQPISGVMFSLLLGGQDRTSEYAFAADPGNATEIPPGAAVDLAFLLSVSKTAAAGTVELNASASGGTGAPGIPAPIPVQLPVLRHAQLEVLSQSVDGATCRNSREAILRTRVRNAGESTANLDAAVASILRGAADVSAEFLLSLSTSNAASLAPGEEADLDVLIGSDVLTLLGPVDASAAVPATDARSAVDASIASGTTILDVHEPATLSVSGVTETRVTVSKGQTALTVTATVGNSGSVPATIQTGGPTFAIGGGDSTADYTITPPSFGVIAAGDTGDDYLFTVTVKTGAASGASVIGAVFDAADAVCGETPTSSPAVTTGAWTVQTPPILVASVVNSTTQSWAGDTTTVTLTVQNDGEATANTVAPTIAVAGACPTCASLTAVDTGAKNIVGGGSATYQWTGALSVPLPTGQNIGVPRFDASGAGTDANTAGAVGSGTASGTTSVEARRPTACFTYSPTATPVTGVNLFAVDGSCSSDLETADAALTYEWDWTGDGIYDATGMTATHDYTAAGKNVVALRVTDADGRVAVTQRTLLVELDAAFGCVTTTVDENDAGATPALPVGGGFSLREAINWSAGLAGRETVCFDAGLAGQTITFTGGVLPILPAGGIRFAGRSDVTIDFGALSYGFRTRIDSEFFNLRLTGVAAGGVAKIVIGGDGVDISECEIFGGGGAGIAWDETLSTGPANALEIVDSNLHDNETDGIRVAPVDANNVEPTILRNRVWDNGGVGIDASRIGQGTVGRNLVFGNGTHGVLVGADNGKIVNNTVAFNGGDGIRFLDCGCATDNKFWNNLVFDNGGFGLVKIGGGNADSSGKNYVFGNDLGQTSGSGIGLQPDDEVGTIDPLLEADFELARTSPCRNTGRNSADTPDANGRDTGNFYGTTFDIGAWESPR